MADVAASEVVIDTQGAPYRAGWQCPGCKTLWPVPTVPGWPYMPQVTC